MLRAKAIHVVYANWCPHCIPTAVPDYLIPQVFVELEDGEVEHVLTGYPEGVDYTRVAVDNLVKSEMFRTLRAPPA